MTTKLSEVLEQAVTARNEALSYHTFAKERLRELRVQHWEAQQSLLLRHLKAMGVGAERPVRVLFLVAHTSLWDVFAPVYAAMKASADFEPRVLAFNRMDIASDVSGPEIEAFYHERSIDARLEGFSDGICTPLEPEAHDILFYTLGSGAYPAPYKQEATSSFFLTCYLSYGFLLSAEYDVQFNQDFHHAAWRIFCSTRRERDEYTKRSLRLLPHVVETGYPKFDLYRAGVTAATTEAAGSSRPTVIWAPHWTIGLIYPKLNLGLFDRVCNGFLEVVRDFPEIDFVYKPHPNLEYALAATTFMDAESYQTYIGMLTSFSNARIWKHGDYLKLFRESAAMITDSSSFLAEYLPTERPLLFLDRRDRARMSSVGEEILTFYDRGESVDDIRRFIVKRVLERTMTERGSSRARVSELLGLSPVSASEKILAHLRGSFARNATG